MAGPGWQAKPTVIVVMKLKEIFCHFVLQITEYSIRVGTRIFYVLLVELILSKIPVVPVGSPPAGWH